MEDACSHLSNNLRRSDVMELFQIDGKFEQNQCWSDLSADFSGFLVRGAGNIVRGYTLEKFPTPYDKMRFICGIYEDNRLVFVKMVNERALSPLCYVFPNIEQQGYWDGFSPAEGGFFPQHKFQGHATIQIIPTVDNHNIAQQTLNRYDEFCRCAFPLFHGFMDTIRTFRDFFEERWAPHE